MCDVNLVYGYGISGVSAVELLLQMGKTVAVYDDDNDLVFHANVRDVRGMSIDDMLEGVILLIASPSILMGNELISAALSRDIEVVSELELGYRNCNSDIIAITGTNGKTTTTLLIKALLDECGIDAHAVGNIGKGFCSEISYLSNDSVAVLEASSYQLAAVDLFAPKIAICLNISPDHIEYHKSFGNYIDSKSNIFRKQCQTDYSILNYDDVVVRDMVGYGKGKVLYYSLVDKVVGVYIDGNDILHNDGNLITKVCELCDICMEGEHNLSNALAVINVAKILKIPNNVTKSVLNNFYPPDYRVQYINTYNGVRYYNDSKSTNIKSTECACLTMSGATVLIMGGYDKGLDYSDMFRELPENVIAIIVYGANKDKLFAEATSVCNISMIKANDIYSAVDISSKFDLKNVLFSPATSSYDMFDNYTERGKYFNLVVHEYFSQNKNGNVSEVVE